jgi:hypothetical protein
MEDTMNQLGLLVLRLKYRQTVHKVSYIRIIKHLYLIIFLLMAFSKIMAQNTEIVIPGTPENSYLYVINSNGDILFTIKGTGEIEIGTANPSTLLSVKGNPSQIYGGYFETISNNGIGIKGYANNPLSTDSTYGGYFISNSNTGTGCYGISYGRNGIGIHGETKGERGVAINGIALTPGGYGGLFTASGNEGIGVYGKNISTEGGKGVYGLSRGDNGCGMYGLANGRYGIGIHGESIDGINGIGVKGYAGHNLQPDTTYGGHFTSESTWGIGCYGTSNGFQGIGIFGESSGRKGIAVCGTAIRNMGPHPSSIYGGYFLASETNKNIEYLEDDLKPIGIKAVGDYYGGIFKGKGGIKCFGESSDCNAVWAFNNEGNAIKGTSIDSSGVCGSSITSIGVQALSHSGIGINAVSDHGVGLYVKGKNLVPFYNTTSAAAIIQGDIVIKDYTTGNDIIQMGELSAYSNYVAVINGNMLIKDPVTKKDVISLGTGFDIAEGFNIKKDDCIIPGSVLVIDTVNTGYLCLSYKPYDKRVAGIVSGANGLSSGIVLKSSDHEITVALAGRVYCKVDATTNEVQPGDLLTTSYTPGYAMKITDFEAANGAIIGKAMEKLDKGKKGEILILVALQ